MSPVGWIPDPLSLYQMYGFSAPCGNPVCCRQHQGISLFDILLQRIQFFLRHIRFFTGNLHWNRLLRVFLGLRIVLLFLSAVILRMGFPFRICQGNGTADGITLAAIFRSHQILGIKDACLPFLIAVSILVFDTGQDNAFLLRIIGDPFQRSLCVKLQIRNILRDILCCCLWPCLCEIRRIRSFTLRLYRNLRSRWLFLCRIGR